MINSVQNRTNHQQTFGMAFKTTLAEAAIEATDGCLENLKIVKNLAEKASKHQFYDIGLSQTYKNDGINFIQLINKKNGKYINGTKQQCNSNIDLIKQISTLIDKTDDLDKQSKEILDLSV